MALLLDEKEKEMKLKKLEYTEFKGQEKEWSLEGLILKDINLLVGINSTGKTRTLNVIGALGRYLAGINFPSLSGNYRVFFENKGIPIEYHFNLFEEKVRSETLLIDSDAKLMRDENGKGKIFAEKIEDGQFIEFEISEDELAVVAKRDKFQHSFLEPLFDWSDSLRHYLFGTTHGKDQVFITRIEFSDKKELKKIERDPTTIVPLFEAAKNRFGDVFFATLKEDLNYLGYEVEEVCLRSPSSIMFKKALPTEPLCIAIKEKTLSCYTDQFSMSQGLFRAICLLARINYFKLQNLPICILVDDIGEGLDYDRACRLINVLREKVLGSEVQLIMSTNDQFVMNQVPLNEWRILVRNGSSVRVMDYENSTEAFENFKFMGLNNFDFLTSKLYLANTELIKPD